MVHLIQATAELALGLEGLEGKVVMFGLGGGGVPFCVLSATEATRYTGLAVLVSKPSKADTYCVCPNVAEGLKKGGGGNITAKGADWASVQKAD